MQKKSVRHPHWCNRGHNLNICLATQLLVVTRVVAHALFWPHCWSLIQIFISDGRPHPNVLSIWGAIWEFVQISLSGRDRGLFALSHPCRSVLYHMCWKRSRAKKNLRQRKTVSSNTQEIQEEREEERGEIKRESGSKVTRQRTESKSTVDLKKHNSRSWMKKYLLDR